MRKLLEKSSLLWSLLSTVVLIQFSFSQVLARTCIEKERKALLQLKKSFDDPSHRLATWKGTNFCNWDGVGCNETTGHITKIDLRYNYQVYSHPLSSNSIDSSLLEFKYLNYLDLSMNYFDCSQIPHFLGSMLKLRYLNLSGAFFYWRIPPRVPNIAAFMVSEFSFYSNYNERWKLHICDVERISRLSSLQFLDLSWINFSEVSNLMQVLSSLPLLSSLRLKSCSLQNVHLSFGFLNSSFLTRIQLLDLSNNNFNGPIPNALQNMTSLRFLYLSNNQFTTIEGGLPSLSGNHCGLKVIDLSRNIYLSGDVFGSYENVSLGCNRYDLQVLDLSRTAMRNKIPNWLGMFKHLESLNLFENNIYGPIPASLGNLSSIEYLDLSTNDLSGAIPTSLGRLLNLRKLSLGDNRVEGEVSVECFEQLGSLEELDISENLLKGIITEAHFANLSQLHTLVIGGYNEHLSLDMKANWVPPFQLNFLYAESCIGCFGSEFPKWLQTQKALVGLQLSNTSISSVLPAWLRGQNLTSLYLSHNQIMGPLPTSIGDQMPKLRKLFLNNNLINGSLPPSICKWKDLVVLDVSYNKLSGMIHGCFLTLKLSVLDLSSNKFSGPFPYSPGNASNLEQLYLRNNNFEGSMPIILKNAKYLFHLDLGGNHFSGNIPTWVSYNLRYLRILKLRGNRFNGTIPSSLCLLPYLQILDLAHNHLGGNIPPNLSNFSAMTGKIEIYIINCPSGNCIIAERGGEQHLKSRDMNYSFSQLSLLVNIDLSNNSLVGFIPSEITMLKKLLGLNLSHNNLVGTIPIEMGAIESLESLDLSFNLLYGPIPQSMSKLSSLGVLELSHNNLSGNIPREGHLSTFNEASSFDGNPFLCGDPLPAKCVIEKLFEPPHGIENLDQEENKWEKWLLYIIIMLGYATGFWAVVGGLILKRSWRYAYFKLVDETQYKVHAAMWWSIEKLKEICIHK